MLLLERIEEGLIGIVHELVQVSGERGRTSGRGQVLHAHHPLVLTFEIQPKIKSYLPPLLPASFKMDDFVVFLGSLHLDVLDQVHFISYLLSDFLEILYVVDLLAYLLDQLVHKLSLH